MKILFIIPSIAKGGQEKAGMLLCNYLMDFHDVTVVCFEKKDKDDFDYKCKIVRIDIPSSGGTFTKAVAVLKRLNALRNLKKQLKPDYSIAFGNTAIILNGLTAIGEKKISSIRQSFFNLMAQNSLGLKIHRSLYVYALKRSAKIVSVSKDINVELKHYFNINNKDFVNNGFNLPYIQEQAKEPVTLVKNKKMRLVHTGRFDTAKGHWHLVKIFVEVKKEISNLTLVLLGGADQSTLTGNEIIQYCKSFIEANGLTWSEDESSTADVLFLGHQKNPYKYLAQSQLFVFPSIWEGFPNALIEAMCCSLPVVAADCPTGPKDILVNQDNGEVYGLLLPAFNDNFDAGILSAGENDKFWSDQIVKLLSDPIKLNQYKNLSEQRAADFSIKKMGEKWNAILAEI